MSSMTLGLGPDNSSGVKNSAAVGTGTSVAGSGLDGLSVTADGAGKSKSRKEFVAPARDLDTVLVKKSGDWGLHLFLKVLAGHQVKDGHFERRCRVGSEVDDPRELKKDPFVAKRTPTGDLMITFSTDPEKLKSRYERFAIVSADLKRELAVGRLEGNTVIFPDSKGIPDNALIVRQPYSFVGDRLGGKYLSFAESKMFRTNVVESLLKRSKCCRVGVALGAGKEQAKSHAA